MTKELETIIKNEISRWLFGHPDGDEAQDQQTERIFNALNSLNLFKDDISKDTHSMGGTILLDRISLTEGDKLHFTITITK